MEPSFFPGHVWPGQEPKRNISIYGIKGNYLANVCNNFFQHVSGVHRYNTRYAATQRASYNILRGSATCQTASLRGATRSFRYLETTNYQ